MPSEQQQPGSGPVRALIDEAILVSTRVDETYQEYLDGTGSLDTHREAVALLSAIRADADALDDARSAWPSGEQAVEQLGNILADEWHGTKNRTWGQIAAAVLERLRAATP